MPSQSIVRFSLCNPFAFHPFRPFLCIFVYYTIYISKFLCFSRSLFHFALFPSAFHAKVVDNTQFSFFSGREWPPPTITKWPTFRIFQNAARPDVFFIFLDFLAGFLPSWPSLIPHQFFSSHAFPSPKFGSKLRRKFSTPWVSASEVKFGEEREREKKRKSQGRTCWRTRRVETENPSRSLIDRFRSDQPTRLPSPGQPPNLFRSDRVRLLQSVEEQREEGRGENVGGQPAHLSLHGLRHLLRARLHGSQEL